MYINRRESSVFKGCSSFQLYHTLKVTAIKFRTMANSIVTQHLVESLSYQIESYRTINIGYLSNINESYRIINEN